jgi:hypothetical protein
VSIPAEYPCVPGAYQIGEGLTYLGIGAAGAAVPGLDEAEAAETGADAGVVTGTAPEAGAWAPPDVYVNARGELTNGEYTISEAKMAPHLTGNLAAGKSQWFSYVDAETATLDAASYADANNLWVGNTAKVPVINGEVGVLGRSGEPTSWINVYRTNTRFLHGSPGNAP